MNLLIAAAATLVFCAPGYPGGAGDAQPYLDQFAADAAKSAGWPTGSLNAVYDPTEAGGLAKLASSEAVLAFVPYPFYVQHATQLHLKPIAQADVTGTGTRERWTLVAKAGRITAPASLAGYTILSVAGYAPDFVRHAALGSWGIPADVRIESTGQILSALRKVAAGEQTAALLDQTQDTSLTSLPFAAQLANVTQSAPLPVALVAVVDARLPQARVRSFQAGLLKLGHASGGSQSLASLRLQGFVMPQLPADAPAP
ncbi:MAG TPA: PhnD/SsuA/transferrin family substrate-binding protein [Steroidobacteraceae bacterium]